MATPQLLTDISHLLVQLAPIMALVSLVLAGIALRNEGGTNVMIGGGFTKWMFWAIVMIVLPQTLLWFSFFGVPTPDIGGGVGSPWIDAIRIDVTSFVNDFVVGRIAIAVAAFLVIRAILDACHGRSPLPSIIAAMFLLTIPATAALISEIPTGARFAAADVMEGLWNFLAGRIMPIAAGLAVIGAIFNFMMRKPAMRLVGSAVGLLTVSAVWKLLVEMM